MSGMKSAAISDCEAYYMDEAKSKAMLIVFRRLAWHGM